MSTTATTVINALLSDAAFNSLVADLKSKRDEIAGYQFQITSYTAGLNQANANLVAAQAEEATLQQQIQTSGAAIIAANL